LPKVKLHLGILLLAVIPFTACAHSLDTAQYPVLMPPVATATPTVLPFETTDQERAIFLIKRARDIHQWYLDNPEAYKQLWPYANDDWIAYCKQWDAQWVADYNFIISVIEYEG